MRKYFCDRCGEEIKCGEKYYTKTREYYRWRFWFSQNHKERYDEIEHEICLNCQRSLWDWWSEVKK